MGRKLSDNLREMPRMKGLEYIDSNKIPKNANMPKEVDIVTANDIFCGALSGGDGHMQHCLLGLSCINFGRGERGVDIGKKTPRGTAAESYVDKELQKSVRAFTGIRELGVIEFNDSEMGEMEKYWIARVWNATMARIGYVEGNPEAK